VISLIKQWHDSCVIDRIKKVVFLGVILDEHISWKPHISHVARKISKSIGIIYKASFFFQNLLYVNYIIRLFIPIYSIVSLFGVLLTHQI
jgi:hypothetical protein